MVAETIRVPVSIIRQGEDGTQEDYRAQIMFHLTQNDNGETTAQVDIYKWECK